MALLAVLARRYSSPPILTNPQIFGNKTCLLATILLVSVENADEADDESLGVGDEDVEDVGDIKMLTSKNAPTSDAVVLDWHQWLLSSIPPICHLCHSHYSHIF